jgi:hypothetical protein
LNNKAKIGPYAECKIASQILGGARGGAFGVAFGVGPFVKKRLWSYGIRV